MSLEKMCYPIVIGLNVIEDENEDSLLYTNRDMLNEGVFIELSDYVEDENNHFQTLLSINHVNSNKVDIYTICEGTKLLDIQLYRIIKDLLEIYQENSLENFFFMMDKMGSAFMTSSNQNKQFEKEMIDEAHSKIEKLKSLYK